MTEAGELNDPKVIPIEAMQPHRTSEVICIGCARRWWAVRPASMYLSQKFYLHKNAC